MNLPRIRIPAPPARAIRWLIGTAALISVISACDQVSASGGQAAADRSAGSAAASAHAHVVKAPSVALAVKHADLISGVSCVSQACTAVGDYYDGSKSSSSLAERWDGSAWQLEPAPDSVRYSGLVGVSCANSTNCLAAGAPALTWRGKGWQVIARSTPFTSVSCVTDRLCLGVGVTGNGAPVYGAWYGGAWRTARLPAPRVSQTREVAVGGLSCATAEFCLVVGGYATGITAQPNPASRDQTLAEEWDGRSWRPLRPANVSRRDAFSAVSCVSPANCTAVGASVSQYPIAEHWDGTSWRIEHIPAPGKIGYTQLSAVSCASVSVCVAVGNYQGRPVAEISHSGSWRLQWLPHLAGDDNPLQSVSCATAATCMAVGNDVSASSVSFAERWNGTRWQLLRMPNPR